MKLFLNFRVIKIDCQPHQHHGQDVEETSPEGDQVVFPAVISLAPALTGHRPLNVVLLLAGLELNGDNIGV